MTDFKLRFPTSKIQYWAGCYLIGDDEKKIESEIVPKVAHQGYLDKDSFLLVCAWKTPRSKSLCKSNSPEFIEDATRCALSGTGEELKISVLTLLRGVSWPTASVILHWFSKEPYPLLDVRALWSLGIDAQPVYDYDFWLDYTKYCRKLADSSNVSMRVLDRALWQYSKDNQLLSG